MEQIVITKTDGTTLNLFSRERPSVISKATQKVALLSDDLVSLTVVSAEPVNFDFGDTITVFGKKYRLNQLPEPTKEGERKFTYEMTFEGIQYDLIDVMFKLPSGSYGEQLYGDLEAHLTALLWNINRVYPGKWALGTFPTGTEYKNLNAQGKNCLQVLQEYCDEYGVEFEIVTNASTGTCTLNIVSKTGSTFAHTLQYGRGRGLYKLQRKNVNNAGITTRLYVYGSTENIPSDYARERHTRLCLPEGKTRLTSYIEDAAAKAQYGIKENEKTYDDIKPQRVGHVTALGGDVLTFYDSTMFDLNAKTGSNTTYLIPDTTAKITFQTGNLAGYSFDLHSYDHATHKFVINKFQDENGMVFPSEDSEAFQIRAASGSYEGDAYIIEDINLPGEYVTAAETKLLEKATEELAKVSQPQVSYSLELDEQYFIHVYGRKLPTEVLHVGDAIHIIDTQIGVDKEVRITRIERDLLKPHTYTVQLSDTLTKTTTVRVLNELQDISDVININHLANPSVARRRWKTAQELLTMVFDPDGDYYTDRIKPLSIETTMLAVGAKSQQFVLQDVTFEPNYNGDYAYLRISDGTLAHYNIPITVNGVTADGIKFWFFNGQTITLDNVSAYYIYAKCNRSTEVGTWYISSQEIRVEEDATFYHFLVGTVSSPIGQNDGRKVRCVSLTYGFSTINGRFIKTGRIESTAGSCYFDLDNNEIGGVIHFVKNDGTTGNVADTEDKTNEVKDYINNTLPGILDGIQEQIDGVIEQWFYTVAPSPLYETPWADEAEPNSSWTTEEDKEKHLGDLYYNTETGQVWRYVSREVVSPLYPTGKVCCWKELEDTETAQALALAQEALETANKKAQIFTATPTTPYYAGDLWVQGSTGDIMRCKTERLEGSFSSSDWEKASKYTDDTSLANFINNNFADTVSSLTSQIDGKIESWFQATDPAASWTTDTEKGKHTGDMWYNTATKVLSRYTLEKTETPAGATYEYLWKTVEDQTALSAYDAASKAQDTADGKRQVFVSQPYPPYDIGDLWLTGGSTDGELRRCATARKTGSFVAADWVTATYYDNTRTTIDGGIVTAGTVQLANANSQGIVAGITGGETEASSTADDKKVRIWAGATKENRFTAPFRVCQDGSFVASKGNITGEINAQTGSIGGFEIGSGRIGSAVDGSGKGTGLSIYDDFINITGTNGRVLISSNSTSASWGYSCMGYFENKGRIGSTSYGIQVNASGGFAANIALGAQGAVVSDSYAVDYGITEITPQPNKYYFISNYDTPTPFRIMATFPYTNSGIGLPTRQSVKYALGLVSDTIPFAVRMNVVCSVISTQTGYILGRNTDYIADCDSNKYPQIIDYNGYTSQRLVMSKGDAYEFLLVWDGKGENNSGYYAYTLNVSQ